MKPLKLREARTPVQIPVRIAADAGWGDGEIRNVSSGGVKATSTNPPKSGEYVELRRGAYSIVGRVVWVSGSEFGLQAQGRVSLADLSQPRCQPLPGVTDRRRQARSHEPLTVRKRSAQEIADASVRHARLFDFIVMSLAVVFIGYVLVSQVSSTLNSAFEPAAAALTEAAE